MGEGKAVTISLGNSSSRDGDDSAFIQVPGIQRDGEQVLRCQLKPANAVNH